MGKTVLTLVWTLLLTPHSFAQHRKRAWPYPAQVFSLRGDSQHAAIYDIVRSTGLPNCMSARIPLPNNFNISRWEEYADGSKDEADLIDYVRFGFPLGYMGPVSATDDTPNHDTAAQYPQHVDTFITVESEAGALSGPYDAPPFTPWVHVSPIMSRPKAESDKRRIITDLTFPQQHSINAYIMKNSALGEVCEHSLPSVADLVTAIRDAGPGAHMFTIDIARAYKNFSSDPLDCPLLCIRWRDQYFIETSMPFGARASSCFMQRVANSITRILGKEGITAIMYLDDIVVVAPDLDTATTHYDCVRALLAELGLPEAVEKTQPPATTVLWLGINIDAKNMTLSIRQDKVQEVMGVVTRYHTARSVNKRQLQSLIGKLVHVAKCVEPAAVLYHTSWKRSEPLVIESLFWSHR